MQKNKFEIFNNIIEEMKEVYLYDNRPWMIGYSGGKDSTLLCCLLFEMLKSLPKETDYKRIYVVSSDTMVENPIVKNYMHDVSSKINKAGKKFNITAEIIYPKIENTFWCKVIGLGYPTPEPPGFRWCTDRLKIHPMNDFTINTLKNNGEVVLLLGVRKAESSYRAQNIRNREIDGKLLVPHSEIENAYVYNPLTEISNEIVWEYLLKDNGETPWNSSNKYLFSLYQGDNLGEEKSVVGEIDKDKIPVTGNSRFGCWICTMVKEDKSLMNFINRGSNELIPLRDFRNWLLEIRNDSSMRDTKRRNGSVYVKSNGEPGFGPFTMEGRKIILERLLKLEQETGIELITQEELKYIDKIWEEEGDLSKRALVDLYFNVKGTRLPWDKYKKPLFEASIVNKVEHFAKEYDVPFELISKLIIEIEKNKNFTRSTIVNKSFDKVLNQGWLHQSSIKEGMEIYDN
ncbi:MAG: DNA phosphorothioation system sulfurtransferase DndC [Candidatus Gastranaerophilales bacterium]|nr:DNA phosphorothioation system sulfurtransferase DndC [Candidatus Gastranaerophilales bacterium]